MSNPNPSAFGAAGAMTNPFEFMQKMWQGTSLPGIVMPTLSVEEINKKITDLKAVESWLTLNMSMLRGTIQTLEVQSGTLTALQSMSAALGASSQSVTQSEKPTTTPVDSKFESPFTIGHAGVADASATPSVATAPAQPAFQFPTWSAPADAKVSSQPATSVANANPSVWWNLLQEQFAQAVGRAVNETAAATPAPDEPKADKVVKPAKLASKPVSKTTTKSVPRKRKA